ncbi:MAG TPA: 6-phospho-3-hexuloisomerase [Planctomycetota bacterium]|nr:6-phospho-3-hexuloisomerase [Planctomycetota bacterium]
MEISHACYRILEELSQTIDSAEMEKTPELLEAITTSPRVFVAGAGRSGLMVRSFAQRLMQLGIDTYVVGETTTPEIRKGDLIIIGSGSGTTGGPVSYARIAKHAGARVAAVTAAGESPLRELTDILIRLPAPTPKVHEAKAPPPSVQPLGSLFEQTMLVYLDALIIMLMEKMDVAEDTLLQRHTRLE